MVLELATVLLGACVGAIAVLYAAPKGYLGHPRKRGSSADVATVETTFAPVTEYAAPAEPAPVAEPAPSPAPAIYETVQPETAPPPVSFASSPVVSFGASPATKKPTRNYRRRAAPVRSSSSSKKMLPKTRKR